LPANALAGQHLQHIQRNTMAVATEVIAPQAVSQKFNEAAVNVTAESTETAAAERTVDAGAVPATWYSKLTSKIPAVKLPVISVPSVKMPSIKLPTIKAPKVKMPEVDFSGNKKYYYAGAGAAVAVAVVATGAVVVARRR
jgi:hypothetical protein